MAATSAARLGPSGVPILGTAVTQGMDESTLQRTDCMRPDVEVADPGQVCGRALPAVAFSVADDRSFAVHALADIPADVVDDIRLMVSEPATTASEHSMTGFHLTICRSRQEIRVEITVSVLARQ